MRDGWVLGFNLFPAETHEVDFAFVFLGQAVQSAELPTAVLAVIAEHLGFALAACASSACGFLYLLYGCWSFFSISFWF
jgi:hypothetical protein